ncbi:MAG: alginate export family protein [Leptospiraceae bacterium]|nr:alginate export family protein [Leptospiraceae bacterium]
MKLTYYTLFFFLLYSNSLIAQNNSDSKDSNLEKFQELELKLKADKEKIDENLKALEELKKNSGIENKSEENKKNIASPMKKNGLDSEFTRNYLLTPNHSKQLSQNEKMWLTDWIRIGFLIRPRFESRQNLDFNSKTDDYLNRVLQTSNVWFLVDPSPYLSFKINIQDARVWGGSQRAPTGDRQYFFTSTATQFDPTQSTSSVAQNNTDIREAFAILKHPDVPLKLSIGRQILSFGDQRMIGGANWITNPMSFDGVRLTFNSKVFDSNLFGVKISDQFGGPNGLLTSNGRRTGSIDDAYLAGSYNSLKLFNLVLDLYGFGIYKKWIPKTYAGNPFNYQPAFLGETIKDEDVASNSRSRQRDDVLTFGFRLTNRTANNALPQDKNLDWTIESAWQSGFSGQRIYKSFDPEFTKDVIARIGSYPTSERVKYTGQFHSFQTGYTFTNSFGSQRIGLGYTYSSGDSNRQDGSNSTFQLLPNPRFSTFPYWNTIAGQAENIALKNIRTSNLNFTFINNRFGRFTISGFIHKKAVREDAWYGVSGDANTGGLGSCSERTNATISSTENCSGMSYKNKTYLGSEVYRELGFTWMYDLNDYVSIITGFSFLKAGDSIRNIRDNPLSSDPNQRYTFNPNGAMFYLMINIAM